MSETKIEVVIAYIQHIKHLICSYVQEDQQYLPQQNEGILFPIQIDQNRLPKAERRATKAPRQSLTAVFFVRFDILLGISTSSDFRRCDLLDAAAWERGRWVEEPLALDFLSLRGALAIDAWELKGSAVNAM
jgi:hypothetical protein